MEDDDAQAHPTSCNRGWRRRRCELCRRDTAALYCDADAAYLCEGCDESVHGANFLVARHCRRLLCNRCCTQLSPLTRTGFGSGSGFHMPLCDACANADDDGRRADLSNVERCGSRTKADAGGQQQEQEQEQDEDEDEEEDEEEEDEEKAEEILKRWQWWLGLQADTALVPKAVRLLRRYLEALRCRCRRRGGRMSLRLCLAVSFFVAASASASASASAWAQEAAVRRFERCCRVPAPVIALALRRLSRLCRRKALETQEGFGETS